MIEIYVSDFQICSFCFQYECFVRTSLPVTSRFQVRNALWQWELHQNFLNASNL